VNSQAIEIHKPEWQFFFFWCQGSESQFIKLKQLCLTVWGSDKRECQCLCAQGSDLFLLLNPYHCVLEEPSSLDWWYDSRFQCFANLHIQLSHQGISDEYFSFQDTSPMDKLSGWGLDVASSLKVPLKSQVKILGHLSFLGITKPFSVRLQTWTFVSDQCLSGYLEHVPLGFPISMCHSLVFLKHTSFSRIRQFGLEWGSVFSFPYQNGVLTNTTQLLWLLNEVIYMKRWLLLLSLWELNKS
jgi:hypothetical protein